MQQLTKPFANYPHIRKAGPLVFLAGQGCRDPETNSYRGTVIVDNQIQTYDIAEQTRGVLANIERALKSADLDRRHLIDVTVFLMDMRDFDQMNQIWNEFFKDTPSPTRTTVCVTQLPGHNRVEMKAIAYISEES